MTSAQKIWADQNGVPINREVFDALAQKQVIYTVNGIVKQVEDYQNNTLAFMQLVVGVITTPPADRFKHFVAVSMADGL